MTVFAHRGASAYAPQNTIPAFRRALEMGAQGIELDVQLTSDGVPVVIHDFELHHCTDMSGFVHQTPWREIRRADAGSSFSPGYRGVGVPSLEEVLNLIPTDVMLNIELKAISCVKHDLAGRVCKMLNTDQGAGERRVMISSFNHPLLMEVQERMPAMPLGILSRCEMIDPAGYADHCGLRPYSLNPAACSVTKELCDQARSRGWKVLSYTVNNPARARHLEELGVDGVFSDRPDLLFQ